MGGLRGPILVVHSDLFVATRLVGALRREHRVMGASTAAEALRLRRNHGPMPLALLQVDLPDLDSAVLQSRLRARGTRGVLMLARRGDVASRDEALRFGADDYLVSPFPADEVLARSRAVVHRTGGDPATRIDDVVIDPISRSVTVADIPVTLTRMEFELLAALVRAGGAAVTRRRLLAEVWSTDWAGGPQTITVHVATLRSKLMRPQMIEVVRGVGYRLATRDAVLTASRSGDRHGA